MGKNKDEVFFYCKNCEVEIPEDKLNYVGGKPYCEKCYREAEEYGIFDEDYDDDDDDDDDD